MACSSFAKSFIEPNVAEWTLFYIQIFLTILVNASEKILMNCLLPSSSWIRRTLPTNSWAINRYEEKLKEKSDGYVRQIDTLMICVHKRFHYTTTSTILELRLIFV